MILIGKTANCLLGAELQRFCLLIRHVTYMASHVNNLANKYEDHMLIRSSVLSYNVSRWLLLKKRTRPLLMRRIT